MTQSNTLITDPEVLKKPSTQCNNSDDVIKKLWACLDSQTDCIGLAAPQIGIFETALVIKFQDVDKTEIKEAYVNPVIVEESKRRVGQTETCLSYPDHPEVLVMRPEWVRVKDECNGTKKLTGFKCRVFLHEFDHFKGGCAILNAIQEAGIGRNDPCHCGSGKKYKKCHG